MDSTIIMNCIMIPIFLYAYSSIVKNTYQQQKELEAIKAENKKNEIFIGKKKEKKEGEPDDDEDDSFWTPKNMMYSAVAAIFAGIVGHRMFAENIMTEDEKENRTYREYCRSENTISKGHMVIDFCMDGIGGETKKEYEKVMDRYDKSVKRGSTLAKFVCGRPPRNTPVSFVNVDKSKYQDNSTHNYSSDDTAKVNKIDTEIWNDWIVDHLMKLERESELAYVIDNNTGDFIPISADPVFDASLRKEFASQYAKYYKQISAPKSEMDKVEGKRDMKVRPDSKAAQKYAKDFPEEAGMLRIKHLTAENKRLSDRLDKLTIQMEVLTNSSSKGKQEESDDEESKYEDLTDLLPKTPSPGIVDDDDDDDQLLPLKPTTATSTEIKKFISKKDNSCGRRFKKRCHEISNTVKSNIAGFYLFSFFWALNNNPEKSALGQAIEHVAENAVVNASKKFVKKHKKKIAVGAGVAVGAMAAIAVGAYYIHRNKKPDNNDTLILEKENPRVLTYAEVLEAKKTGNKHGKIRKREVKPVRLGISNTEQEASSGSRDHGNVRQSLKPDLGLDPFENENQDIDENPFQYVESLKSNSAIIKTPILNLVKASYPGGSEQIANGFPIICSGVPTLIVSTHVVASANKLEISIGNKWVVVFDDNTECKCHAIGQDDQVGFLINAKLANDIRFNKGLTSTNFSAPTPGTIVECNYVDPLNNQGVIHTTGQIGPKMNAEYEGKQMIVYGFTGSTVAGTCGGVYIDVGTGKIVGIHGVGGAEVSSVNKFFPITEDFIHNFKNKWTTIFKKENASSFDCKGSKRMGATMTFPEKGFKRVCDQDEVSPLEKEECKYPHPNTKPATA